MAYVISRFQEGISLNPREFVLNENDEVMKFETVKLAEQFLINAGIPEETISDEGISIDDEDEV